MSSTITPATRTLLDEQLDLSVKLGNVLVPARSLQTALGHYCQHLFVWTHDKTHKVQLVGTSVPVRYRSRYFLLCCKHQLKDVNLQDVCMMYPDGSLTVTSSGSRVFNANDSSSETDVYDIAAFEFTKPCQEHPELEPLFFDFTCVPPDVPSEYVLALVVAGFPSSDQVYEVEEKNHIGSVKRNLTAIPDGQPEDQCLLRARFVDPIDFDPDGFSGAPVFVVQFSENQGQSVYLGGMVLRSGREKFYFLKSGYIWAFLDSFA